MTTSGLDDRALDRPFALARGHVEAGVTPFAILGLANAAGTIRLEAFSAADRPRVGAHAVCLLASITKPIVATAFLRLVELGEASLTTDVRPLPGSGWRPFSAWHVLSHTTGLGDVDVERLLLEGGSRPHLLEHVARLPQESEPGSRFRYASAPFDVLAESLAADLGRGLDDVVDEHVLRPLGMVDTTFDPAPTSADRMAPVDLGELRERLGPMGEALVGGYVGLRLAGGGLWSTADDVLRFGRAMLRGGELDGTRVLARPTVELMTREVTVGGLGAVADPLRSEHYALGWAKPGPASPASTGSFGHGGASGTRLWVDPAHDLVVLYLGGSWELPAHHVDAVLAAVYAALP